jgi:hypothetical protein
MIKADRKKASARGPLGGLRAFAAPKTPFYFNELNEHVNEKIPTSNTPG